jgi:CBS domain-containing protein|tara:strand:- start:10520 stop:10933 length:414 start_codon:yes stop_codon:yes gene_type:complete
MCAMMLPRALRVADFMTSNVLTVTPDMDVLAAMGLLLSRRVSGAPVIDGRGNLVGMLTERDCLQTLVISGYHDQRESGQVAQFMSRAVITVEAEANLLSVAQRFLAIAYRRYPVVAEQQLVGIISRRDVLRAIATHA